MLRTVFAAAALTGVALAAPSAQAASRIGTLDCAVGGSVGMVVGSSKRANCNFIDQRGRRIEAYAGDIAKLGLDVGVTAGARMVWAVVAETSRLGRGALAGNYTGAAADASVGVGGGVKVLVGGSRYTITLQPISVQAQSGVNIAVGVESMTLTPAARR